jgi:hypothetical protein
MADSLSYKVARTMMLCEYADDARTRDLNRQFDLGIIDALDPEGIHVVFFSMPHHHRDGEPYELHFRTGWLLKVKGTLEPVYAMLDMMPDPFNSLPYW